MDIDEVNQDDGNACRTMPLVLKGGSLTTPYQRGKNRPEKHIRDTIRDTWETERTEFTETMGDSGSQISRPLHYYF